MSHDAIDALRLSGYAEREAAFLYLVAIHSGYFLRRQFCEFVGRERGSIATHFLRRTVAHSLVRAIDTEGRNLVYHLSGKSLYRMLGEPDSQNRRTKSGGEVLRRLMTVDIVLRHLAAEEFLETESAKRLYFAQTGVDGNAIASAFVFGESIPVAIPRNGENCVTHFYFVDEGQRSLSKFVRFLTAYKNLLRALPHAEVRYLARRPQHFEDAQRLFARRFSVQDIIHPACPLGIDHLIRWLTVNRKFHGERRSITPVEHRLLQEGGCIYCDPIHAGVIASWNNGTMDAKKIREVFQAKVMQIVFQTELIEASYPRLLSFAAGHATGHDERERHEQITLFPNEMAETTGYG
jgi:hypothetical protein